MEDQTIQEFIQTLERFAGVAWEQTPHKDLKPSECRLLGKLYVCLEAGEETIRVSDLSDRLDITPAAVTHLVNPLEANGYIERQPDSNDRRVVLIVLTAKGEKFGKTLITETRQRVRNLVEHLGKEDSITFIRLMDSIINFFNIDMVGN